MFLDSERSPILQLPYSSRVTPLFFYLMFGSIGAAKSDLIRRPATPASDVVIPDSFWDGGRSISKSKADGHFNTEPAARYDRSENCRLEEYTQTNLS
jgi:hypothetical protein